MFHGCALRGIPIIFFCIIFIACVIILLCSTIITAIKNKNNNLSFKEIIKESFSDLLDEGLDIGICILAGCFILMVITIPISYSKEHALKEAQFYHERYITLSEEINKANNSKENIPKELETYDMILLNKKIEQHEVAKKKLDYWSNMIIKMNSHIKKRSI